ncbi:MAG: diguanylate cyclase [Lachnospiraceae bacterium]|nr:diguanylate cyclase [Lachnospiraceae bacterium]
MAFGLVPLEKRLKENIKHYRLSQLYDIGGLTGYLDSIGKISGLQMLLTDRHGEKAVCIGDFVGFVPDVVNEPGEKIKIMNRTIGHLYIKGKEYQEDEQLSKLVEEIVEQLAIQGYKSYACLETSIYADELEKRLEKEQYQVKHGEKQDALTATLSSTYFDNRMKVIDRSDVVPVAVLSVNINDWKFFNDHFGDEESDRLIQKAAEFLKEEAKPDYVIGRCGGDCFSVLIPMAEEGEAEDYCRRIKENCSSFQDEKLILSIACGIVTKTNVEEKLETLLSDAEYEMFDDKFSIKNAPGYRERLEKLLSERA